MRDDDLLLLDDDDEPGGADPFDPLGLGSMEPDFADDDELDLPPRGSAPDDEPDAMDEVATIREPQISARASRWDDEPVGEGVEEDEQWATVPAPAAVQSAPPRLTDGGVRAPRPGSARAVPPTRGKLNAAPRRGVPRAAVGAMAVAAIGLPGLLLMGRSSDAQTTQATAAPRTVTVTVTPAAPAPTTPKTKPAKGPRKEKSAAPRVKRQAPARRSSERSRPAASRPVKRAAPQVAAQRPATVRPAVAPRPRRVYVAPVPSRPSRATKSQVTSSFGLGR